MYPYCIVLSMSIVGRRVDRQVSPNAKYRAREVQPHVTIVSHFHHVVLLLFKFRVRRVEFLPFVGFDSTRCAALRFRFCTCGARGLSSASRCGRLRHQNPTGVSVLIGATIPLTSFNICFNSSQHFTLRGLHRTVQYKTHCTVLCGCFLHFYRGASKPMRS